jgi:hypothetical protein
VSDDPKKIILARRARFIAAAVASVGVACGKTDVPPQPCLSEPMIRDDAGRQADNPPEACLSVAFPHEEDAGAPPIASMDAGVPRPCLSEAFDPNKHKPPKPLPQKCLSIMRPPEDAGRPTSCLKIDPEKLDEGS